MKTINVYFISATKNQFGYIKVEDDETIEQHLKLWSKQGFVKCHYRNDGAWIYIPWQNVAHVQYAGTPL